MPSATPYENQNAPRSELQELQLKSQQCTDEVSQKAFSDKIAHK